jgi:pyruvate-formate lyase-activating enzyme
MLSGNRDNLKQQWRDKRLEEILSLVDVTPEEKAYLRRYVPLYKALDEAHALPLTLPEREAAAAPHMQKLLDQFRSEI